MTYDLVATNRGTNETRKKKEQEKNKSMQNLCGWIYWPTSIGKDNSETSLTKLGITEYKIISKILASNMLGL